MDTQLGDLFRHYAGEEVELIRIPKMWSLTDKAEIEAAKYIASAIEKPVIAYLVGLNAAIETNFGDTETIIMRSFNNNLTGIAKIQATIVK